MTDDQRLDFTVGYVRRLQDVVEAVIAMRENLIVYKLPDGTLLHGWYSVAPAEYGEAVDVALTALENA